MCGRTLWGHVGKEGVQGLSLASHEEVPRGFGLRTGDRSDTADGAGNRGRPAWPSTDYWEELGEVRGGLLFFLLLEGGTSDWCALRLA